MGSPEDLKKPIEAAKVDGNTNKDLGSSTEPNKESSVAAMTALFSVIVIIGFLLVWRFKEPIRKFIKKINDDFHKRLEEAAKRRSEQKKPELPDSEKEKLK